VRWDRNLKGTIDPAMIVNYHGDSRKDEAVDRASADSGVAGTDSHSGQAAADSTFGKISPV